MKPIIGAAGGVLTPLIGHLRSLRQTCHDRGILLIVDEIVTGLGRTGTWFACEREGVVPDTIAVGTGMASGYTPMAAVLLSERIVAAMRADSGSAPFGHTFSANPLSAATFLAVLRLMQSREVLENAKSRSLQFETGLLELEHRYACLANVRGTRHGLRF